MDRKEILKTVNETRDSVVRSNCKTIEKRAGERKFQVFLPNRFKFLSFLIRGIRRILVREVAHALELELERQEEINLRLVKEIRLLQKEVERLKTKS